MDEQTLQKIKLHLQNKDAQDRIRKNIEDARSKATVTISQAASLFGFSENQLRDWEKRFKLIETARTLQEGRGHRQYSRSELDKLAIIKELLEEGHFAPGDLPSGIDEIWVSVVGTNHQKLPLVLSNIQQREFVREADSMPIVERVNHAYYQELFWRLYASRALWLSTMLIQEDNHFTRVGLILPLRQKEAYLFAKQVGDLPKVGESLVGWLGPTRSFYTLLTHVPFFDFPSDFNLYPLKTTEEDHPTENTLLAIPRLDSVTRDIVLSTPVVETVRRLLAPLYSDISDWNFYLGQGMRDIVDPLIDFSSNTEDIILTHLMNTTIRLGGVGRWKFCCLLTPNLPYLPYQRRSLVVRAKSQDAPSMYKIGTTAVSPTNPVISISLRAYQGGRVIYHHRVTPEDRAIVNREWEEPGSAIAIPIGGEDEIPMGVLYVAATAPDSFNDSDQRVLRIVARIVQELLVNYRVRQQVSHEFLPLLRIPGTVDPTFGEFASETDFICNVESLLHSIQGMEGLEPFVKTDEQQYTTKDAVSFIAVDIDGQTGLTDKYGDRVARNLSHAVGQSIQRQVAALFTNLADCKLYHVYADRYYLLLNKISLEETRAKARLLKQYLDDSYQVDAVRFSLEQPTPAENLVESPKVTVRMGVGSYTYAKLQEVLARYPAASAISSITGLIIEALDKMLKLGQDTGGDNIVSWDYKEWIWKPWSPSQS